METYLTVEEMAKTLKVEVGTVRRWLRTGKLRGLKMDRVWRIPLTEIDINMRQILGDKINDRAI